MTRYTLYYFVQSCRFDSSQKI